MTPYEAIGIGFVIFSTAITSIALFYLALLGLRSVLKPAEPVDQTVREIVERSIREMAR